MNSKLLSIFPEDKLNSTPLDYKDLSMQKTNPSDLGESMVKRKNEKTTNDMSLMNMKSKRNSNK